MSVYACPLFCICDLLYIFIYITSNLFMLLFELYANFFYFLWTDGGIQTNRPKVSFETLDIPIRHWERSVLKRIPITASTTFFEFRQRARVQFADEIKTQTFRVYRLPHDSLIENRVQIKTEDDFLQCVELCRSLDPDDFLPDLYIWNCENNESPQKLPGTKKDEVCSISNASKDSSNSNASKTSGEKRSKVNALVTKKRDGYKCRCCGTESPNNLACHIFELKMCNKLSEDKKKELFKDFGLRTINEYCNYITLCNDCHKYFDAQKLAIHPDHKWIVTEEIRSVIAPNMVPYGDFLAKKIIFLRDTPDKNLLEFRMSCFCQNTYNIANNYYCHRCYILFTEDSSKDDHSPDCILPALGDMKISGLHR